MCDYYSSEDISTIENGGCVGTSYTRDGAQRKMWKQQEPIWNHMVTVKTWQVDGIKTNENRIRVQLGVTDYLTFKSDDMKIEIDTEFLKALINLVKWLLVLMLVMA